MPEEYTTEETIQTNVLLAASDREYLKRRAAEEERTLSGQVRWLVREDRNRTNGEKNQ